MKKIRFFSLAVALAALFTANASCSIDSDDGGGSSSSVDDESSSSVDGGSSSSDGGSSSSSDGGSSSSSDGGSSSSSDGDFSVPGANLEAKFLWLKENAQHFTDYTLEVNAHETITAKTLNAENLNGSGTVKITLVGVGAKRMVQLSGGGPLFTIKTGYTLVLGNNINLMQGGGNGGTLIDVDTGGKFFMEEGSSVTGVTNNGVWGGAVQVSGTFTMNGGTISDNNGHYGGGVAVYGGTFTMNGGSITGNTVSSGAINNGGGVYVDGDKGGTFTMTGGTISGNIGGSGGGVYVGGGTFTMSGGAISGNQADDGGGVLVAKTFNMSGGVISGNTASLGGGVFVHNYGNVTKTAAGGIIYGNDADDADKNTATGGTANKAGHAIYIYGGSYGTGWRNSTITANEAITAVNGDVGTGTWGD